MEKVYTIKETINRNLFDYYSKNLKRINKNLVAYIGNPEIELFVSNSKELFSEPLLLNKELFYKISKLNKEHNPDKIFIYARFIDCYINNNNYHIKEMMNSQDLINNFTNENYKDLYGKIKIRWVMDFPKFLFYEENQQEFAEFICVGDFLKEHILCLIPKIKKLYGKDKKLTEIVFKEYDKHGKCNSKLEEESENLSGFIGDLENLLIFENKFDIVYNPKESESCSNCGVCCYIHGPSVEVSREDAKTIEKEIKKLPKEIQAEIKLKAGSLEDFWIDIGKGRKEIPVVTDEDAFLTSKLGFEDEIEEAHPCVFLAFPYRGMDVPLERIGKCNIYDIRKKLSPELLCNSYKCIDSFPRWTVKKHFEKFSES